MLKIFSEAELIEACKTQVFPNSACISIGDPGSRIHPKLQASFETLLRLEFFDEDFINTTLNKLRIPESRDIVEAISFNEHNVNKDIVLHCNAGIGRSPAFALMFLFLQTNSETVAKDMLLKIRPVARPNRLLISLFDNLYKAELTSVNDNIWQEYAVH